MDGAIARRSEASSRIARTAASTSPDTNVARVVRLRTATRTTLRASRHPELDCIRHRLPAEIVARAERRAAEIGVGGDRVLIAEGRIAEETYLRELAAALGMTFEPLENIPRHACPIEDDRLVQAAITGLLPLTYDNDVKIVVAPGLADTRRLVEMAAVGSDIVRRFCITSPARLQRFVGAHGHVEIGRRAVDGLRLKDADFSASPIRWRWRRLIAVAAVSSVVIAMAPEAAAISLEAGLGVIFFAWSGLRLASITSRHAIAAHPKSSADGGLPIYSIIVALYRETAAVEGLIVALQQLRYPTERLDIKIVVEPDDRETLAELVKHRLTPPFEILIAPNIEPRTKPKALNVALPFVRGDFIAVYDAEDRPEPDQLRLALEAFTAGDRTLACVQARLTIDNSADGWLPHGIMAQTPQGARREARGLGVAVFRSQYSVGRRSQLPTSAKAPRRLAV